MSREPCQEVPPGTAETPARAAGRQPASESTIVGSPPAAGEAPPPPAPARQNSRRPSLGGGIPAQGRELGAQGRLTIRRLLEAGLAEFDERGFQAVRVDDVVRRAKTSHGTFYLYFANKDDLFRTLLQDALHDMQLITDDFPVVTPNPAGRAALRHWIQRFTDTYGAHATVIRILSQAEIVGEEVYGDGLRLLFRLSEAITQGMTAGAGHGQRPATTTEPGPGPAAGTARAGAGTAGTAGAGAAGTGTAGAAEPEHAELTALACLMMLERINYLLSVEVRLPRAEMIDRLTAIIYAAFHTS
jgi:AcrR family transcriptional regulator